MVLKLLQFLQHLEWLDQFHHDSRKSFAKLNEAFEMMPLAAIVTDK
jgi:hypothetical protein